jgi:regulator of protease activity HflC (stomatin/prohibitin superfamily)
MDMSTESGTVNRERVVRVFNGWVMLPLVLAAFFGAIAWLIASIVNGAGWINLVAAILLIFVSTVMIFGFFALQPNEARVLVLFGAYKGTVREPGFCWGNPFYSNGPDQSGLLARLAQIEAQKRAGDAASAVSMAKKHPRFKISLRARNFNSERLKVNDKRGNPIEIAAVVVWKVQDTAQAVFDVDDFENYVRVQSESALRHLASAYAYDHGEENEVTLRSGVEEVSHTLKRELEARLSRAGVAVDEARLTHLAYAPEIAQVMLRRQQAEAVIAARKKIVHGAVSMVDMALKELADKLSCSSMTSAALQW